LDLDLPFRHFGLSIEFENAIEIAVHDEERRLDPGLRALLDRFGPLSLRNAYLSDRSPGQRNVFQSLSFHIDRGGIQDDKISLFWRDPFDPLHYKPRSSSTLVLANVAAYLQALKEGESEHEFKKHYYLFENEDIDPLIDDVLIELDWRADDGVVEISVVDNQTVLHASYYPPPPLQRLSDRGPIPVLGSRRHSLRSALNRAAAHGHPNTSKSLIPET